jgi:hypothetical protein
VLTAKAFDEDMQGFTKCDYEPEARGRYEIMCSVTSERKGQKLMEKEDSWCKTANPGKTGYTIGVRIPMVYPMATL